MWKFVRNILTILALLTLTVAEISGQRISVKKCDEYKNLFREEYVDPIFKEVKEYSPLACPSFTSDKTIVGGRNTRTYEYPAMASLMYADKNKNGALVSKCGGVLISEQFVLSAAHCLKIEHPKKITLGEINLAPNRLSIKRVDLDIAQVIVHPDYKPPAAAHDIALLKLARPFIRFRFGLTQPIRPACLQQSDIPTGSIVNATGFGLTEAYGDAAATLQTVGLPTIGQSECSDFFRDALDFDYRFPGVPESAKDAWVLPATTLCAGGVDGKDTCQGDSGGPLFYSPDQEFPCHRYVVGVTSFGSNFCGSTIPGVYTKIAAYIDWIERHVWP